MMTFYVEEINGIFELGACFVLDIFCHNYNYTKITLGMFTFHMFKTLIVITFYYSLLTWSTHCSKVVNHVTELRGLKILSKQLTLDGIPFIIRTGLYKYYRISSDEWEPNLSSLKDCCAINSIEIEIPWRNMDDNQINNGLDEDIESSDGQNNTSLEIGNNFINLLSICRRLGIKVIANLGPTICGQDLELSGLPLYVLKEKEGKRMDWWPRDDKLTRLLDNHWNKVLTILTDYRPSLLGSYESGPLIAFLIDPGCIGLFDNPHVYLGHLRAKLDEHGINEALMFPITPAILKSMAEDLIIGPKPFSYHNSKTDTLLKDEKIIFYSEFEDGNIERLNEMEMIFKNRQSLFIRKVPTDILAPEDTLLWGIIPENRSNNDYYTNLKELKDKLETRVKYLMSHGVSLSFSRLRQGFLTSSSMAGIKYVGNSEMSHQLTTNQAYGSILSEIGIPNSMCKIIFDNARDSSHRVESSAGGRMFDKKCKDILPVSIPLSVDLLKLIVVEKVLPLSSALNLMKKNNDYYMKRNLHFISNQDEQLSHYLSSTYVIYSKKIENVHPGLRQLKFSVIIRDTLTVVINGVSMLRLTGSSITKDTIQNFSIALDAEELTGSGMDGKKKKKTPRYFFIQLLVENLGLTVDVRRPRDMKRQLNHLSKGLYGILQTDKYHDNHNILVDWEIYKFDLDSVFYDTIKSALTPDADGKNKSSNGVPYTLGTAKGPAFFWATFNYETSKPYNNKRSLYLHMIDWYFGYVILNGYILGKYDHTGPQQTLYCPLPYLRDGINEVLVFEEKLAPEIIDVTNYAILDESYELSYLMTQLKK